MTQKNEKHLIIFTASYPDSAVAESFLDPELAHLCEEFDRITLVPRLSPRPHETVERNLPNMVRTDHSIQRRDNRLHGILYDTSLILRSVMSRPYYSEVHRHGKTLFHVSSQRRLIGHLGIALVTRDWVLQKVRAGELTPSETVLYSYWLDGPALGCGLAKYRHPDLTVVSRAHGFDLYEEAYDPPYGPLRETTLACADRIFPISRNGRAYLSDRYPAQTDRYVVSRLGVPDPGFATSASGDGVFRVVSCSYTIPLKRLDLLIAGLAELGRVHPKQQFAWTHIGYGPLQESIEACAQELLPKNVQYSFAGYLPKSEVMAYYQTNAVDAFINVSETEGIPVSIMEAQSCGIPTVATAVGGTSEIVSGRVGILLDPNPSPGDIAGALTTLLDGERSSREKRFQSKSNWKAHYNADTNFSRFARQVRELLD